MSPDKDLFGKSICEGSPLITILEFDKTWIHGYFHLIGYDHKKLIEYKKMTKKENLVLKHFHKVN